MPTKFDHIDHWIFDLDNVLYPVECNLFSQIDVKMGEYIAQDLGIDLVEARKVQKGYFHDHGTTLAGLMHNHDTDPQHFLDFVHDIDMSCLSPAPLLREAITGLPGEKLVFTNSDAPYAERVLKARGLEDVFDQMHDILACDLRPKPSPEAYQSLIAATGVNPDRSLFVEDMARNLRPAKDLGMTTIWVNTGSDYCARDLDASAIDHEITNLEDWLVSLKQSKEPAE